MPAVPRVRDTLQIQRIPPSSSSGGDEYSVSDRRGQELFRLGEEGYFLLLQMDGLTGGLEVISRFQARFGRTLTEADLDKWTTDLSEAGVITENSRAARILTYLREQGVHYRGSQADRRRDGDVPQTGREIPRRDNTASTTAWFDYGISLLNDGLLEQGTNVFDRMADSNPGDVRVQEILGHLRFLATAERLPDLEQDRRDVSWEAFDLALSQMLASGVCPGCGTAITIELGANNRCSACGSSFSTYVLDQASNTRRT